MFNAVILDKYPNDDGIVPLTEVDIITRETRLNISPIQEGIDPDKGIWYSCNSGILFKLHIELGILPVKGFTYRCKMIRLVRYPMDEGIGPVK